MSQHEAGPYDISEFDPGDGLERIDLGSVLVPAIKGMDLQVQVDEQSGNVVQATIVIQGAAVQIQPYAAPKSGGMWDEIRPQIQQSINASGGLVEAAEGSFGAELRAQIPGADGGSGLQPARFVGIDGPRWFLRAVFLGAAARPGEAATQLDTFVRQIVVNRGNEAMPVGGALQMRLPNAPQQQTTQQADRIVLTLPERGPEITEIR